MEGGRAGHRAGAQRLKPNLVVGSPWSAVTAERQECVAGRVLSLTQTALPSRVAVVDARLTNTPSPIAPASANRPLARGMKNRQAGPQDELQLQHS
jgi:hypothetical protein